MREKVLDAKKPKGHELDHTAHDPPVLDLLYRSFRCWTMMAVECWILHRSRTRMTLLSIMEKMEA